MRIWHAQEAMDALQFEFPVDAVTSSKVDIIELVGIIGVMV